LKSSKLGGVWWKKPEGFREKRERSWPANIGFCKKNYRLPGFSNAEGSEREGQRIRRHRVNLGQTSLRAVNIEKALRRHAIKDLMKKWETMLTYHVG